MIKILDLNDNSNDMEIGTANVDRVYGGRGGKKVAGRIGSDYYLIKMPNNLTTRSERPGENIEIPDAIVSNLRKIYYITLMEKRYNECLLPIYKKL